SPARAVEQRLTGVHDAPLAVDHELLAQLLATDAEIGGARPQRESAAHEQRSPGWGSHQKVTSAPTAMRRRWVVSVHSRSALAKLDSADERSRGDQDHT